MEERKDIDDEYRRSPSRSPLHAISHVAPSPTEEEEVDKSDEGDDDNSEEITAVESSIVVEPRSGDSGPYLEDLKKHGLDDPELLVGEPSPPPPEAKGDHSDGEEEDQTEIPGLPYHTSSAESPSTRSANQENETEDNLMSALDISTMKMAVQSGNPKAVDDLMEHLSDTLVVDELTTTYGGHLFSPYLADGDNLFKGTSPILHAVQSGNLAMFESVMKAMQAKLSREQVKDMLAKKNVQHQSLLSLAARSGSRDVLEGVVLAIQQEFTEYQVKDMISCRDDNDKGLLIFAVESGRVEMRKAVMATISDMFAEQEVKEIISYKDDDKGLLITPVRNGNVEMFKSVMATISDKLDEKEVKEMISCIANEDKGLLITAVRSGNVEMFKSVMATISDKLAEEEVKEMISCKDNADKGLLFFAIVYGRVEMFKSVMATISDKLAEEEVKEMISCKDNADKGLLFFAIVYGRVEMFKAVMATISDKLAEEEVKYMISCKDNEDRGLLITAVRSGNVEMFKSVMATISDKFDEEEVKEMISCKDNAYKGLLFFAIANGRVELFKAVMATISDKLAEEEVKKLISGKGDGGFKLLSTAIETARVEMFEVVMATISDKLTEEEVKDILAKKDRRGSSLLDMAARRGIKDVLEHVVSVIRRELSENEVKELISSEGDGGFKLLSTAIGTEKAAMKHGQPITYGPLALEKLALTVNEDQINPKGIAKFLPGPQVQPDAGGDSSQSGGNKLKTIDILTKGVLRFLPTFSLCQCLRLNQELCNSVREHLSDVVVSAERDQPWTVPVDMLTLAGDSSKLTSVEYGVSIEGNNEDLRHLNALLVPAPDFLDIGGEIHISLSPVLRCRWKRHSPNGEAWKVSFSMHNIDGVEADFVGAVSIFCRPNGSSEGAWTFVGNEVKMNDASQAFDEDSVAHATVTGFSDLIAAVKMADAGQRTRGYLSKPISGVMIKRWWSKEVGLYNASAKELLFVQYFPTLLPTSRSGQVELPAVGGGATLSSDITPRDPNSPVAHGYVKRWPRDQRGGYEHTPDPIHECLDTKRRGWGICLAVCVKDGDDPRLLSQFDCDAGRDIILLDEILQKQTLPRSYLDKIAEQMQAGRAR